MRLMDSLALSGGSPRDTPAQAIKTERLGLAVVVEFPKGSMRRFFNKQGEKVYEKRMAYDYGFFEGTKGRDGDEVDAILGPSKTFPEVHVVHMIDMGPDESAREDEDKVLIGFVTADVAKMAFLQMYPKNFYGGMTSFPIETFKTRLKTASLPYRAKTLHASADVGVPCTTCGRKATRSVSLAARGKATCGASAGKKKCPHCGGKKYALMPTDFETAKCSDCGKNWQIQAAFGRTSRRCGKCGGREFKVVRGRHRCSSCGFTQELMDTYLQKSFGLMPHNVGRYGR